MTSPRRARRDDGGGGGVAGGALAGTATLRGGLLIAAAIVIGVVLLGKGFDSGFLPSSSGDPSDRIATGDDDEDDGDQADDEATTTTTPELTHSPGEVRVQVLNSAGPQGAAAAASDTLAAATYLVLDAETAADRNATQSAVYAVAGYEADARAVATALGITSDVQAMPNPPPAPAPADAHVVVVLGPEFVPPT